MFKNFFPFKFSPKNIQIFLRFNARPHLHAHPHAKTRTFDKLHGDLQKSFRSKKMEKTKILFQKFFLSYVKIVEIKHYYYYYLFILRLKKRRKKPDYGTVLTYVFFGGMSAKFSSKNINYLFTDPSSFGKCCECKIIWINLSKSCK